MKDEIINISLKELTELEGLSQRTLNICEDNNLNDINSILKYYSDFNHFRWLRNCGQSSNNELIKICLKYKNKIEDSIKTLTNHEGDNSFNKKLEELVLTEDLSVRSQNVCEYNNLKDLKSIVKYYWENKGFQKIRNCGQLSNMELINLCKKYESLFVEPKKIITKNENNLNLILDKIEILSIRKKSLINQIVETKVKDLNIRSQNALRAHLYKDFRLDNLKSLLIYNENHIKKIKNVGEKSVTEIVGFINSIKELIEIVSLTENNEETTIRLFNAFLVRKFSLNSNLIDEIARNYDFSHGLPIFKTINILLENEILYDHRDTKIFKLGFSYFMNSAINSNEEIAEILKITRERVRQKKVDILNKMVNTFSFLKGFEFDSLNLYGIDFTCDYITIDDELCNKINKNEGTIFNSLFITKILSILSSSKFILIGNEESILYNKSSRITHNQKTWIKTYLISKIYTDLFDFERFANDVSFRLSETIEEDYSFHFQTYLLEFQKEICNDLIENIAQIAEYILFNEFELIINTYDCIVFLSNTFKQVYKYTYEALEALGQPSKVLEIYKKVIELYPNYNTDENSIRASLKRENGFVPFGRSSVYGLKEWEEEKDIRGGTIRDITEEYLLTQTEPKHIDDIAEYVRRYRDTTSKNIYSNLQMEEYNRFTFYKGLCIGLKSKKYNEENFINVKENQSEKKSWDESFSLLEEFLSKNERLPYSTGDDYEQKLYRFFNIQLNKANNRKIDEFKSRKIFALADMYNYRKRARNNPKNLTHTFEELKLFVSVHKRLPKTKTEEERKLCYFYYRQTTLFKKGELSKEQLDNYLEINNLIKLI